MQILRTSLYAALGLGVLAGVASGNAFNINEHDPRVTGRGGATAASNTEPSSIVFNPGGIAVNEGTNIAISGSLYVAKGSYEDDMGKTNTDSAPSVVPSIYVTSRVHDMVAVGLGLHLPFGLAVSWPDAHRQADVIQDQTLRTFFITPSVGLNLNKYVPGLSIGGGLDIVPATVELEQQLTFGTTTGTAHLGGDALGFGGRVGVIYNPEALKQLKIGVMWRSQVNLDFEGNGDFDVVAPYRDQVPVDGPIATTLKMPQSVAGGVAYSPIPALEIELNAVWINWKKFETITIELPDGPDAGTDADLTISPQNYKNTVTFRVGAEYKLPAQKMALRAGFIYDPTPIPTQSLTARLPDIDRKNISLGASREFGNYAAHLGLLWVTPGERDASDEPNMPAFKGTYGVQAFVASLGVSGQFGK